MDEQKCARVGTMVAMMAYNRNPRNNFVAKVIGSQMWRQGATQKVPNLVKTIATQNKMCV